MQALSLLVPFKQHENTSEMRFRNSGWTGTHLASAESLPKVLGHPDGEMNDGGNMQLQASGLLKNFKQDKKH